MSNTSRREILLDSLKALRFNATTELEREALDEAIRLMTGAQGGIHGVATTDPRQLPFRFAGPKGPNRQLVRSASEQRRAADRQQHRDYGVGPDRLARGESERSRDASRDVSAPGGDDWDADGVPY